MLKEALECQRILNEFYVRVWDAITIEFPKNAENVKAGPVYKTTPVNATLDMPIMLDDELLHVKVTFRKVQEGLGEITAIKEEEFGKIPVLAKGYHLPIEKFKIT